MIILLHEDILDIFFPWKKYLDKSKCTRKEMDKYRAWSVAMACYENLYIENNNTTITVRNIMKGINNI